MMNENMDHNKWLPMIDPLLCTGCGDCVAACPTGALSLVNGKAALTEPEKCTYCRVCETSCPTNAIQLPYQIVLVLDARM
jgi:NAD-dependent dihydropyrimidine dehydrogenase PreA subunit